MSATKKKPITAKVNAGAKPRKSKRVTRAITDSTTETVRSMRPAVGWARRRITGEVVGVWVRDKPQRMPGYFLTRVAIVPYADAKKAGLVK